MDPLVAEKEFIIACVSDPEALPAVSRGPFRRRAIGPDGRLLPCKGDATGIPAFFCHVEFLGGVEPSGGLPALGVLPDAIVYNGMSRGFSECLQHFLRTPALHGRMGVYLEPGAALVFGSGGVECAGSGSVAMWSALGAFGREGLQILQFRPGEALPAAGLTPAQLPE